MPRAPSQRGLSAQQTGGVQAVALWSRESTGETAHFALELYRNEDIDEPERIAAKDKVYEIVRTTAEYMRQMEMAPFLKADGLEDGYKVLADFNGTVLAGVQSKHGVHFVTWDWAYGHTGVCHGHYFMENYAGAKQDFAIRSGLIQKERLFTPEQMTEI